MRGEREKKKGARAGKRVGCRVKDAEASGHVYSAMGARERRFFTRQSVVR